MLKRLYERYLLPRLIDVACRGDQMNAYRARWIPQAHGVVVEIGFGTGLNARYYDPAKVAQVLAVDPLITLSPQAAERAAAARVPIVLHPQSAETLPFATGSADSVVVTFSLCSIARPELALAEAYRVLRPGGHLLFCEHGRADDPSIQQWQDRLTPIWRQVSGNCHLNRAIDELIAAAGFRFETLEQGYRHMPSVIDYRYEGIAVRP